MTNKTKRTCTHQVITLRGNDETGLMSVTCKNCKVPMTRRVVNGAYEYSADSNK